LEKESWWQKFSRWIIKYIVRWDLVEEMPPSKKHVLVGAHHTSNWDWVFALLVMAGTGLRPRWVGKKSLFRGIMGPIMRGFGGISVARGARKNFVGQIIDVYNAKDELVIALAPEGTRKYVDHWKSGFYHIAWGAKVPLILCKVNFHTRTIFIGEEFNMTGDYDKDIVGIKEYYKDCVPLKPENFGI
jgi:1-acyl-sn-glycerol-3-phosphate acyltransferase